MAPKLQKKSGESLHVSAEVFETNDNFLYSFEKAILCNFFHLTSKFHQKSVEFLQFFFGVLDPNYFSSFKLII